MASQASKDHRKKARVTTLSASIEELAKANITVEIVPSIGRCDRPSTAPGSADIMLDVSPSIFPQFYQALGYAVTEWQHVEKSLCDVFSKVSSCQDADVAAAIYYSPRDFSVKLEQTHCAARLSLTDPSLLAEWIPLRKAIQEASELRNALAHFQPTLRVPEDESFTATIRHVSHAGDLIGEPPAGIPVKGAQLLLQPTAYDPNESFKKRPAKTKAPMGLQDMMKTRRLFAAIAERTKTFAAKILLPNIGQNELV
jgi:hypothetical protein